MSACICCPEVRQTPLPVAASGKSRRALFNRVTVLLVTVWVTIVTLALSLAVEESAVADTGPVPSLEAFIMSLL